MKQCQSAAVARSGGHELNAAATSEHSDNESLCVTTTRRNKNSLIDDLQCLLPQHWTPVNDSQVCMCTVAGWLKEIQ